MRTQTTIAALAAAIASMPAAGAAAEPAVLAAWPVDPLIKIFKDTQQPAPQPAARTAKPAQPPAAARGETASFQIAVRADALISELKAEASPFALESNPAARLMPAPARFVGYIHVDRPMQHPASDRVRAPPDDFPDPLLELPAIDLEPGVTRAVWLTLPVPESAQSGIYKSSVKLSGVAAGNPVSAAVPLALQVFNVVVGPTTLRSSNWFKMRWNHMRISPKPFSPEYWALLARYASNIAAHRQTVIQLPLLELTQFNIAEDGKMQFDFSYVEKWISTFERHGSGQFIEGEPFGSRSQGGEWKAPFEFEVVKKTADNKTAVLRAPPDSPETEEFYSTFLPALVEHLKKTGRLAKYAQHVADEPTAENAESYRHFVRLMRKYAPELKIIEACLAKELAGSVDIWVVVLDMLHKDFDFFRSRAKAGDEIWHYVCVWPQNEYANRFVELPLLKARFLYWICFRFELSGFLHWGYNYWTNDDPFTHTTPFNPGFGYLPAGDACIVYPGADGPLDSIRHEASRDGIADYELLRMLARKKPQEAMRLARKHIVDFDKYNCDVDTFRETRRELLTLLSSPLLQTGQEGGN